MWVVPAPPWQSAWQLPAPERTSTGTGRQRRLREGPTGDSSALRSCRDPGEHEDIWPIQVDLAEGVISDFLLPNPGCPLAPGDVVKRVPGERCFGQMATVTQSKAVLSISETVTDIADKRKAQTKRQAELLLCFRHPPVPQWPQELPFQTHTLLNQNQTLKKKKKNQTLKGAAVKPSRSKRPTQNLLPKC